MYNIIYSHTVIPKYGKNILSQVFHFTESTATNKKSKENENVHATFLPYLKYLNLVQGRCFGFISQMYLNWATCNIKAENLNQISAEL